ncbi:MAG: hypothetical protein ABSC94_17440 [Polyangiaceae bacterium]
MASSPKEYGSSFSPPVPQPGVNPLGGTVAADGRAFAAGFGAPGGASHPHFGAPAPHGTALMPVPGGGASAYTPFGPSGGPPAPAPAPYGSAPQQAGPGTSPYMVPPNPFGGPPAGYGAPSPYGAPIGTPQPSMPYGQGQAAGALFRPQGASSGSPRRRNPWLTLLLPLAVVFGGVAVSVILSMLVGPSVAFVGTLGILGGAAWSIVLGIQMANELKTVTGSRDFSWWPILVPFYNCYWLWILVPQEVAKAKQMLAVQSPPQPIALYIFLWHFALATDLNDLAHP